jgi:probable HAF family extracellular repeat protein
MSIPRLSPRRGLAAALLATLALAACRDERNPTAPEFALPGRPSFDHVGVTSGDLGTLGGTNSYATGINTTGVVVGRSNPTGSTAVRAAVWTPNGSGGYTVADLGTLGGSRSQATGINDAGVVVGHSITTGGTERAAVWTPNGSGGYTVVDPGTLGGTFSYAQGINDAGVVVGRSLVSGNTATHAAVWTPNGSGGYTVADLGTLGGSRSQAEGINTSGVVVGYSYTAGSTAERAAVWTPNGSGGYTVADLGTLGTTSQALRINDAGVVVGYSYTTSGTTHAAVWTPNGSGGYTVADLGTLGGTQSQAFGINDAGVVVGYGYTTSGTPRAAVWTPNGSGGYTVADRGTLGGTTSFASAINDAGVVAGTSSTAGNAATHAAVWTVVTNAAPVASASIIFGLNADGDAVTGALVRFDASASTDSDGSIVSYAWDFDNDGTADTTRILPRVLHTFGTAGTYPVVLTVTDDDGGTHKDTITVVVETNIAPDADIGAASYSANEGGLLQFTSTSTDANNTALAHFWSFGDGTTSTKPNPKKVYADQGSYTATLIVRDPSGAEDTATATVTIGNVAPTGVLSAPSRLTEGQAYSVGLTSLRDGAADLAAGLEYAFDCGTGYEVYQASASRSCAAFADQQRDSITVRAKVRDKDGGESSEYTRKIAVINAAPVVSATASSVTLGDTLVVQGSFTELGSADGAFTYWVNWGDGQSLARTTTSRTGALPALKHVYAAEGSYTVTLYVMDKDRSVGRLSIPVTVAATP